MVKHRIGHIYAEDPASWGSCRSILRNLRATYDRLVDDHEVIPLPLCKAKSRYDLSYGNGYFLEAARTIAKKKITKLVFLERHPHIAPLLLALKTVAPGYADDLDYYFHVYGDFTLFPDYWREIGEELEGRRISLLCASDRQKMLVRSMEQDPSRAAAAYCPFPVDAHKFAFSQDEREQWRRKLGVGDRHLALYTGRLSLQKGVINLLSEFHRQMESGVDAVLALAGDCDDIGGPALGLSLDPGYFYQRFEEALKSLPPSSRERVQWLGNLSAEELRGLYSAADSFASLSLYHDEDFGMSPAEALVSGLPALLSDWGGYSSFEGAGYHVSLVPVHLTERGLALDYDTLRPLWREILRREPGTEGREAAAEAFARRYSVPAVAEHIRNLLGQRPPAFQGFGWKLSAPRTKKSLKQGLYREIYSHYVGEGRA